jgi:hypothetical protein
MPVRTRRSTTPTVNKEATTLTYVQFPYATLVSLGTDLQTISSKLGEKQHGANDCNGLGSGPQHDIQDAISDFRGEWKTSFGKLNEDIDNWGGLSKAIGDMVSQFDAQAATALAPPES